MGFWSKLTIGILVLLAGFYVKATFFDGQKYEKKLVHEEKIVEPAVKTPKQEAPQAQTRKKNTLLYIFWARMRNLTIFLKQPKEKYLRTLQSLILRSSSS